MKGWKRTTIWWWGAPSFIPLLSFSHHPISQYQKRKRQIDEEWMRNRSKWKIPKNWRGQTLITSTTATETSTLPPSICSFAFLSHHSLKTKCFRLRWRSGGRPLAWLRLSLPHCWWLPLPQPPGRQGQSLAPPPVRPLPSSRCLRGRQSKRRCRPSAVWVWGSSSCAPLAARWCTCRRRWRSSRSLWSSAQNFDNKLQEEKAMRNEKKKQRRKDVAQVTHIWRRAELCCPEAYGWGRWWTSGSQYHSCWQVCSWGRGKPTIAVVKSDCGHFSSFLISQPPCDGTMVSRSQSKGKKEKNDHCHTKATNENVKKIKKKKIENKTR